MRLLGASAAVELTDNDITDVTYYTLVNGSWVEAVGDVTVEEGDYVKFVIEFSFDANEVTAGATLTYEIPEGLAPTTDFSGTMIDANKNPVGTYSYSAATGVITFVLDDDYDTSVAFSFTLDVITTASVETTGENVTYELVDGSKITIQATESGGDLSIDKNVEEVNNSDLSDMSIDYSVEVDSTSVLNGTKNTVTITDTIDDDRNRYNRTWAGSWYDEDSFVLYIKDSNGNLTEVDASTYTIVFTNNYDNSTTFPISSSSNKYYPTFTISDLPALEDGSTYVLYYSVDVNPAPDNADGTHTVKNTAQAESGTLSAEETTSTAIQTQYIKKSGSYDKTTGTIKWTITLNPSSGTNDLDGWTLGDVLTSGLDLVGSIVITSNKTGKTVTLSSLDEILLSGSTPDKTNITGYTFSTDDWTEEELSGTFTIVYYTTADEGTQARNIAYIYNESIYYGATATINASNMRRASLSKSFSSESTSGGITHYYWDVSYIVPVYTQTDTYTDTIQNAVDVGDVTQADESHYGVASEIVTAVTESFSVSIQHQGTTSSDTTVLDYSTFTSNGGTVTITCYDASGNVVTDDSTPVKSFTVQVDASSCTYNGRTQWYLYSMSFSYATIANYDLMKAGEVWTFPNQGTAHNGSYSSTADHSHTSAGTMSKLTGTLSNGSVTYDDTSLTVKLEDTSILYYELVITTDTSDNEGITITDILPAGTELVTSGSYALSALYYNNSTDGDALSVTYTLTPQRDGTTLLTITIPAGYNDNLASNAVTGNTIAVRYALSVADDSDWDDASLEKKIYTNTATWNTVTDTTDTTVTRTANPLLKSGVQANDANGDGTYTVHYTVLLNAGAEDLSADDTVTVTDTLTVQTGLTAYVDLTSVKLYEFLYTYADGGADYSTWYVEDDAKGAEIDSSLYTVSYDSATMTLTLTIPDGLACILVYDYIIDVGSVAGNPWIQNSVSLASYSYISESTEITTAASSVTVEQNGLTLIKVDATNNSLVLSDAQFSLTAYDGSGAWSSSVSSATTDSSGLLHLYIGTNTGGQTAANAIWINENTLYKLTEEVAPTGYQKSDEVLYVIVYSEDDYTELQAFAAATGVSTGETSVVIDGVTISIDDILFVPDTENVRVYFENSAATVTVKKSWANVASTTDLDNISIVLQLYRQAYKYDNGVLVAVEAAASAYGAQVTISASAPSTTTVMTIDNVDVTITIEGWQVSWSDLPQTGTLSGETVYYLYTVQEVTQGSFTTQYVNNSGIASGTIGILNTMVYTSVSGYKDWLDNSNAYDTRPDAITVYLYEGVGSNKKLIASQTVTADAYGEWYYQFDNLFKYDSSGNEIQYSIEEVPITITTTGRIGDTYKTVIETTADGYSLTNLLTGTITISGSKTWVDGSNTFSTRPTDLVLTLKTDSGDTIPLQSNNSADDYYIAWTQNSDVWTYEISNIPKYDSEGRQIVYTVVEAETEGYTADSTEAAGTVDENGDVKEANFTNTLKGSIAIIKQDADGNVLEGVTFELKDSAGNVVDEQTTGTDGKAVFDDLELGTGTATYTITETAARSGMTLLAESITVTIPLKLTAAQVTALGTSINTADAYYSASEDCYYFYNLTYTVTNTSQLTIPTAGGAGDDWSAYGWLGTASVLLGLWIALRGRKRGGNHFSLDPSKRS
ncbi:MAG: Cna B-type domain-containing protein [Clostridiales bacterium]|nr:Cna B-type domain-containing protein [Clostridiales bacterium]